MIDLHCHMLPGIDDGAADMAVSLEMARMFAADGVSIVACTPHILPGLFHNTGPQIRQAISQLQAAIDQEGIPIRLTTGADNHVVQDFVAGLQSGHLLSLGDTRYVLVEPPHHIAPPQLEELFFNILVSGYVPILTHPERLTWIRDKYDVMVELAHRGVWMQLTAGSLTGSFGRGPKYWSERMLAEGLVHIIATDAHDIKHRPPILAKGRDAAAKLVGDEEAWNLVMIRPQGIINNVLPAQLPMPEARATMDRGSDNENIAHGSIASSRDRGGIARRVRRLFGGGSK